MFGRPLAQMLLAGTIASAIGIVAVLAIDWFPPPASAAAREIDRLFDVLLVVSVPVFVLVVVVVLYCVWKFRLRPGQENLDGPPLHGNTRLEIVWTVIPALLILGLVTYAYVVLEEIEPAQPRAMTVDVTAQQFAWTFTYRGDNGERVRSGTLYLPVGRPVTFRI